MANIGSKSSTLIDMDFTSNLIEAVYKEVVEPRKVVVIYAGRFQPPGRHHFEAYKWLVDKFGVDSVYIATSNIVKLPENPLNFSEKKSIWLKYGVPTDRIVQTKNPYSPLEITKTLPQNVAVIFAYGKKNTGRLTIGNKKNGSPSYFQDYEKNKTNLEPYEKHGYILAIPHVVSKVKQDELSGSLIRSALAKPHDADLFNEIFGWYDPSIDKMLSDKFSKLKDLKEAGGLVDETVSKVKLENLDSTIEYTLELYGLKGVSYSKIGNHQNPLLGDIDIAMDSTDLSKFLGLEDTPPTKDELLDAVKSYFKRNEKPKTFAVSKGLNQIALLGLATKPDGTPQEFIGDKPPTTKPLIQLDIMLGVRPWREKYFSGAPESQYKAKYRNLFLSEIFFVLVDDEGSVEGLKKKYLLTTDQGFFIQRFTLTPKGAKKEVSRELKSTDMDFVSKFLFGDDKTFKDIDTFEKVFALFNSRDFRFPEIRADVLSAFRKTLSNPKLPQPAPRLGEGKLSIQRFHGTGELTDVAFLKFLEKIQPLSKEGKLDLSVNDSISVTEKLDGSPCMFGLNDNKKFYMESANSGEVTVDNADRFDNPFTSHFFHALKFLGSYKPFQDRLKSIFSKFGTFKVSSEMFPVLTHKGDEFGDIVFASTKYNKEKLGNKGAFVCFDSFNKDGENNDVLKEIVNTKDTEWKVYDIHQHGSLKRERLVFNLSGIQHLINDPKKLEAASALLRKRKESPEKDALKKVIFDVKKQLQETLDKYAESINTFLAGTNGQYPVEGVVMKIHLPSEDIFFKGTSEVFHQIAEKTWRTRKLLGNIEKVLDGDFLLNVLGLSTNNATTINREIALARQKVGSGTEEATLNKVALELYNALKKDGVEVDSTIVRQKATKAIERSTKALNATIEKWKEIRSTVDPDTVSKTDTQIKYVIDRFNKLQAAVTSGQYTGIAYVVYLLRLLLDKKITNTEDKP